LYLHSDFLFLAYIIDEVGAVHFHSIIFLFLSDSDSGVNNLTGAIMISVAALNIAHDCI
jgi:hypothetical protein